MMTKLTDPTKKRLAALARGVGTAAFWLAVWAVAARLVGMKLILPSPGETFRRLGELLTEPHFYLVTLASLGRVLLGTVLAVVCGVLCSAAAAASKVVDALLAPVVTVIRTTPVVSFIILAVFWLGNAALPVFISFLMVFPLIYTNVREGLRQTPPELLRMAKVFRLSPLTKIRRVFAPSVAPYFFSAVRSAFGLSWKAGVAAEVLVYTPSSIGAEISLSKSALETVDLFAWTATIILLSLLIEFVFSRVVSAPGRKWEVKPTDGGNQD